MPQVLKSTRLEQIVAGAGQVFALFGYKRASMADIAAEAGVALGTLYRYTATKEELFELALRSSLGAPPDTLWHGASDGFAESILRFCEERFREDSFPTLSAALRRPAPADPQAELGMIAGEVFDVIARYRLGIRMLDRSTHEWPELEALYAMWVRGPLVKKLIRYLETRTATGSLRRPPEIVVAARLVIETCATLAMHRHHTPGGDYATEGAARATAIHFVTSAFHPSLPSPA